jgi:hypothetical protein
MFDKAKSKPELKSKLKPKLKPKLKQFGSAVFMLALALLLAPVLPSFADEPKHATAEGDNPALNEGALQNIKPGQEGSTGAVSMAPANWQKLSDMFEKLTKEYYEKAKLKKAKDTIHAEYKVRPWEINTASNVFENGPDWGGILYDVKLQSGPYAGVHVVPKKFNEYSTFHVELFAPYSKKFDCHLLSRVSYPFDVKQEFLKRFKKLVEDFEQYL